MGLLIVFSTFPDVENARIAARALVDARLAACASLLSPAESIYRWEGRIETAQEVLVMIKTSHACLAALERKIKELHPYEVPEIIAINASHASPAYERWVQDSVTMPSPRPGEGA